MYCPTQVYRHPLRSTQYITLQDGGTGWMSRLTLRNLATFLQWMGVNTTSIGASVMSSVDTGTVHQK